ncbi:nicotinate-nucleotide adenylyltransferase [Yersinia ruckeri]|uniref:nicotinate-nucleotide adenylyltransferase n=1 Tax=Yersinia ruckeri TaxID=29486 RepID=UPI0011A7A883|nr:nicotinate-nucleotide adenylyltransferase [Yersinia ruckeri]EKN3345394.1 nicotinate-nucleotide adenylyltransferase [Yersinia ruckeri]ELM3746475.1 nicotinate-nucleotide adenylyltransferase [Yersinia ruckeri]MCK8561110.1 nicotinate-nucleotide adenylyltransferase [Yersinia ruckeri]MCW6547759.1 nicotinate-nucleotide adenylyltransferase [Yersinia ruckeri]MCW6633008.1 nicotinate-nucleotide adenylyltransferase [Yersinia ruckeri]
MPDKYADKAAPDPGLHALFGGTFDPIHFGHLHPVEALAQQVGLQQVILLPNRVPPHRPQPEASAQQRLKMVQLAIEGNPLFRVDDRELQRTTPSYTIDTLESLRAESEPELPLAFIIGQDSLLTLHKWHRWQSLLEVCHLLVCARPGYAETLDTPALQRWLEQHQVTQAEKLSQQPQGFIYLADTPLLDISATEIRRRRHDGLGCDDLLPRKVQQYIELQGLYREP